MIGSIETKTNSVKFSEISADDRPFSFRMPAPEKFAALKAEIAMLGLLFPITVEGAAPNDAENSGAVQYVIIDGHRRYDAIRELRNELGGWEDIPAVVYGSSQLLTHEKLILLKEKNLTAENPYNIMERGRLFGSFFKRGLSLEEMAEHSHLPLEEIQTYLFLTEAPPGFVELLAQINLPEAFAFSLISRFREWLATPYKDYAEGIAKKIAAHWREEKLSSLGWKFLLDFYWAKRPFMAPEIGLPE